jgi:hypothetical protein
MISTLKFNLKVQRTVWQTSSNKKLNKEKRGKSTTKGFGNNGWSTFPVSEKEE